MSGMPQGRGYLQRLTLGPGMGIMGCCSSMNSVLCPYVDKFVIIFIDVIFIYSKNEEDHAKHLVVVLRFLREN